MLFLRRQIDAHGLIAALGPDSPAKPILKCNMIPSLLSFFPPPWLFFAVFKGMLLLSARSPAFSALLRSPSLLTAHSLCSASQITSPFLTRITSTSRARVQPCCGLPGQPPASLLPWPTSGMPPASLCPRLSPSSSHSAEGCSSACQHRYHTSHPAPGHLRHPAITSACPDFPLAVAWHRLNWFFGGVLGSVPARSQWEMSQSPRPEPSSPSIDGQVSVAGWVMAPHDCSLNGPAPSSESAGASLEDKSWPLSS